MSTTKEKEVIWEENHLTEAKMKSGSNGVLDVCDTTISTNASNANVPLTDTTRTKISGIYKIVNKVNGKYYIGSSANIYGIPHGRWYQHKMHLRGNWHYNNHLQSAWKKYGESSFDFVI